MMGDQIPDDNAQQPYDNIIDDIVQYVYSFSAVSSEARVRAKAALLDALGAAIESLHTSKECAALLGPTWPNTTAVPGGFRIPGTTYSVDLLKGAFDMGAMIRYLDHNDAFPGAEWGHPSDNLGAILATADVLTRAGISSGKAESIVTMGDVLLALIKAYEIQGCFQIRNAFNRVGLDHTILVKIASTAVVSWLMGLEPDQARSAVSHAWADGHPLRIYRQAPNAGPRKGWAAGDACMRAVHLALLARKGQPGLRTALTAPRWGFYHVSYGGKEFDLPRPYGSWVAENIVFKVLTAEGHGLTAAEAAWHLAKRVEERGLDAARDIKSIHVRTQKPAMIIINKQGPLHNAADRDHCLRYMVAVIFLKMEQVETSDYQDDSPWATDPRVEDLRSIITMEEDMQFTQDYHNPDIRSAANAIEVTLHDGTKMEARVDFPLGHVRRPETLELVRLKAIHNLELGLSPAQVRRIMETVDGPGFDKLPASHFIDLFQP